MSWFTATHKLALQNVSEPLLTETVSVARAQNGAYVTLGVISGRVFPPGVMKGEYRTLVPSHLKSIPIGAIEVKAASPATPSDPERLLSTAIGAKYRLTVTSQGSRVFEVIGPLNPRTVEIRRKLLVREIHQPERELYLALKPSGYDGADTAEPLPELVRVLPVPFISDKSIETVVERHGGGMEAVNLKQVDVAEIARGFLTTANLDRLLYCLVVNSDVQVTAANARDRAYPRYRFNGSPSYENHHWSSDYPYCVRLVEDR